MADGKDFCPQQDCKTESASNGAKGSEKPRSPITRRDFFARSNAGALAVGMMTGTGFAASLVQTPTAAPPAPAAPKPAAVPAAIKTRRVTLDIDSKKYDVSVDVRESLWETMNYQLGLSN